MSCSKRLRATRIEFLPPEKKEKDKNHSLRDLIEDYEDRHKKLDDWKKAQVTKALEKQQEGAQKRMRGFFNFLVWAHVLFVTEFIILKVVGVL